MFWKTLLTKQSDLAVLFGLAAVAGLFVIYRFEHIVLQPPGKSGQELRNDCSRTSGESTVPQAKPSKNTCGDDLEGGVDRLPMNESESVTQTARTDKGKGVERHITGKESGGQLKVTFAESENDPELEEKTLSINQGSQGQEDISESDDHRDLILPKRSLVESCDANAGAPPRADEIDRWRYHTSLKEWGQNLYDAAQAEDEDPDLPVSYDIPELQEVFELTYGFETELWNIPDQDSHMEVNQKIIDFSRLGDNSKEDLKILYYAGHGKITSQRLLSWTTWRNNETRKFPTVKWSNIQSVLEEAESDVLLLLDCCNGGVASTDEGHGVPELLAACAYNSRANGVGYYSFTHFLVLALKSLALKPSFSIGDLFSNIYRRSQSIIPDDEFGTERHPAPVHVPLTSDGPFRRSIQLSPRIRAGGQCITPTEISKASTLKEQDQSPEFGFPKDQKVPRLALAIRLRDSLRLKESSDDLFLEWLRNMPAIADEVKVEAGFDSLSTLLIVSVPISLSGYLPWHPAVTFLGPVTSSNLLTLDRFDSEEAPIIDWEFLTDTDRNKRTQDAASVADSGFGSKASKSKASNSEASESELRLPSFLFIVNELPTNDDLDSFGNVPPRTINGRWHPPEVARGFLSQEQGQVYRWANGVVTAAPAYVWQSSYRSIFANSTTGLIWPAAYSSATVFYCNHFDLFFTIRGDASTRDIASSYTEPMDTWQPLTFFHENNISRVDHAGDNEYLAVRQATWIDQLVPYAYRCHTKDGPTNGGLGGLLPIVIALVAFSCRNRRDLYKVLIEDRSWRGHRWVPHLRPTGRIERRGMVVSVYEDPENPTGSTGDIIRALEHGPIPIFR